MESWRPWRNREMCIPISIRKEPILLSWMATLPGSTAGISGISGEGKHAPIIPIFCGGLEERLRAVEGPAVLGSRVEARAEQHRESAASSKGKLATAVKSWLKVGTFSFVVHCWYGFFLLFLPLSESEGSVATRSETQGKENCALSLGLGRQPMNSLWCFKSQ